MKSEDKMFLWICSRHETYCLPMADVLTEGTTANWTFSCFLAISSGKDALLYIMVLKDLREVFRKNALDNQKSHIDNTKQWADTVPVCPDVDRNRSSSDNILSGTIATNAASAPLAGSHSRDNTVNLHASNDNTVKESASASPEASLIALLAYLNDKNNKRK